MRIEIITPCSRPENILIMSRSVPLELKWNICYDAAGIDDFDSNNLFTTCIQGGIFGNHQRNKLVDLVQLEDTFIYGLDDDNILHEDFYDTLISADVANYDIVTFDQVLKDGTIRKGDVPREGHIDMAQYMIRKRIYEPFEQHYSSDGMLIERLVRKYPERWIYLPIVLSYYNKLKW
jgi:hypothetical protein